MVIQIIYSFKLLNISLKIIVACEGKRHVPQLLTALQNKNWLVRFYTSLAAEKLFFASFLPKKAQVFLKKRGFPTVETKFIRHKPQAAVWAKFLKKEILYVQKAYKLYDKWVAKNLENENFDVLIGYETSNLNAFQTAKKLGKITVLDLAAIHHNVQRALFDRFKLPYVAEEVRQISALKEEGFKFTDYYFVLSTIAKQSLVENGIDPSVIYPVSLGVNLNLFEPKTDYPETGTLRLLFVGSLHHYKGLPMLVQLMQQLKNEDIHLTVVGADGDFERQNLNLPNITHIPFMPHEDLRAHYRAADIFVFPSAIDSWGLVVLEAMASGTPVLVADSTGASDAVRQGGGFVLSPNTEGVFDKVWFDKILFFYKNRNQIKTYGRIARSVAEGFSWDAYHAQVQAALLDIWEKEKLPKSRKHRASI